MEKSASGIRKQIISGLLILFALPVFSKSFDPKNGQVKLNEEVCFTNTPCEFKLEIPGVEPDKVQSYIEYLPGGIEQISSRKESIISEEGGTSLLYVLQFKNPGTIQLKPLFVRINGRSYRIPFEKFNVYENPDTILPELSIRLADGTILGSRYTFTLGQHVELTLLIKFAVQIVNFKWEAPQNAVLKEIKRYEITEGVPRGKEFSSESIEVAKFDWQPLKDGNWSLPEILVTATAYNGSRVDLALPDCDIKIISPKNKVTQKKGETLFDYAFSKPIEEDKVQVEDLNSMAKPEILVNLRSTERRSFMPGKIAKQRRNLEKSWGITLTSDESSRPQYLMILISCGLVFVAFVITLIIKRFRLSTVFLIVFVPLFIIAVIGGVKISHKRAIYNGGIIATIPELSASSNVTLPLGSCVRILNHTGHWCYINSNDVYGWVEEKNIIPIQ